MEPITSVSLQGGAASSYARVGAINAIAGVTGEVSPNREQVLRKRLEQRITDRLTRIRQQMSMTIDAASSESSHLGNRLDISV